MDRLSLELDLDGRLIALVLKIPWVRRVRMLVLEGTKDPGLGGT